MKKNGRKFNVQVSDERIVGSSSIHFLQCHLKLKFYNT